MSESKKQAENQKPEARREMKKKEKSYHVAFNDIINFDIVSYLFAIVNEWRK